MSEPNVPPPVPQKAPKPPGILPKNTQTYLMGGLALLMVVIIAFSGGNSPKAKNAPPPIQPSVVDPNAARIQEYRESIEEQTRKLQQEQAQLSASKQAFSAVPTNSAVTPAGAMPVAGPPPVAPYAYPHAFAAPVSPDNGLAQEEAKREYESRFASNIALTYRKEMPPTTQAAGLDYRALAAAFPALYPPSITALAPLPIPFTPGSAPASAAAATTATTSAGGPTAPPVAEVRSTPATDGARKTASKADDPALRQAEGSQYRLFEGTVIETVLTNRLDGTFSGPVNCMVTTPVYSHDGQHMLIPSGSRVLGEVHKLDTFGQERLAVTFHRLITPDGYSLSLDQFHGLNQIGETGLQDLINHHYFQIFGVSLAIGAIAGLAQANTNYGTEISAADMYRQGVASSLSQSSLHILDRYLNILPTFTIREGQRVKVILSDDLLLPAYENHRMPTDL